MSSFVPGKSRANLYLLSFVSYQVPGIDQAFEAWTFAEVCICGTSVNTEINCRCSNVLYCLGCPTAITLFVPQHRTVLCVVRSRLCDIDINRAGLWLVSTAERGLWLLFFLRGPDGSHRGTSHRRAAQLHQLTSVSSKQYERSCYYTQYHICNASARYTSE